MKPKASLFSALMERAKLQTAPKARRVKRRELQLETLEERILLSVTPQPMAAPLPAHNVHAAAHALSKLPVALPHDTAAAAQTSGAGADQAALAAVNAAAGQGAHPDNNQTISWIGGDGFWDDPTNWSTGTVPDSTDTVTINPTGGPFTITIRTVAMAATLQCADNLTINPGSSLALEGASSIAGTLTMNGDVTVGGTLALSGTTVWNGGVLGGGGTVTNSGTFSKPDNNLSLAVNLTNASGGTLNLGNSQVSIGAGLAITNQAGGILNLSGSFTNGDTGTIVNAGTLNCTGGTPTILAVLNNTGTIHVSAGTLTLRNGGTSSGIMNVDQGATLQWLNGTGTGTFLLDTGAQTNGVGTYLVTAFGVVGITAGQTMTFQNLQIEPTASIGGDGNIIIPDGGVVTWDGGSFYGTGKTTIELGGVANAFNVSFGETLEAHVMDLYGTINLNSTALNLHNAATLNVMDGAFLNLYGTASITGPSASVLNILGTITGGAALANGLAGPMPQIAPAGLALAGPSVSLDGTVHLTSGTLSITSPLTSSGKFIADAGTTIAFNGGFTNCEIAAGAAWEGPGLYLINTFTTVTLDAGVALTVQNLQVNGTLAGVGSMTIAPNGTLTFPSGGTMDGVGTTTLSAGATATGSELILADGRTFTNDGTLSAQFIQTGGTGNSTFNNEADGILNLAPPAGQTFAEISGKVIFNNFGTINFTAGAQGGTFDTELSNNGTFNALAGEVTIQELNVTGGGTSTGTFNAAPGATLSFLSGYTFNAGTQWTGAGTFKFISGVYNFPTGVTFSPQHAALNNATFSGAGAIAVPVGASWTASFPTVQNLGAFTVGSGATLAVDSFASFSNVSVTNHGLITVTANSAQLTLTNGTHFTNAADGEVRFVGLTTGGGFLNSSTATFTNNGLLRNASSAGTFSIFGITFSNPGTLETDGGTFTIFGTLPQVSADLTMLIGGTWLVLGGTLKINELQTQDFFGNPLSTVVENDANVTLSGAGTQFNALNNLATNNGDLAVLNGATLNINAFVEDPGSDPQGPIPGPLTNNGTLEIGAGAAVNVGTDYTQTSGGTLTIHISDTATDNGGGMLHVAGTANLAGTLATALDGGFVPVAGDNYSIATFATRVGDFTTFTGVQPLFNLLTSATGYTLQTTGSQADLTPIAATVTTTGVVGDDIIVNYTVLNQSNFGTAASAWTDSIYLSPTAVFDAATAILVGRAPHTGAVDPNTSYNGTLTTALPEVTAGTYYVIVIADSRGLVADSNRANNRFTVATTVNATVASFTLGTPVTGTIVAGQTRLYQIALPAGVTRIALNTDAIGAAELLVRNAAGEQFAFDATTGAQSLLIDVPTAGNYFVELSATALAGVGTNFTLLATTPSFSLDSNSPIAATNNGQVTLTIHGAQISSSTVFSLVPASGPALTPTATVIGNATTAFVTFDLTGVALGAFDVQAVDGANQSTLSGAFTVLSAPALSTGEDISLTISGPSGFRAGFPATLLVTYRNNTGVDQPAPLLLIHSDNGTFKFPDDTAYSEDYIAFFGLNKGGGDPGVLPPGYRGTQFFQFLPENDGVGDQAHYAISLVDPSAALDYTEIARVLRPANISDAAWAPVLAQLQVQLGATYGTYAARLAADAKLISDPTEASEPIHLLALELEDAFAATGTSLSGTTSGLAVAGNLISAINQDTGEVFTTDVRADGSFVIGSVTPGSYQLQVDDALVTSGGAVDVAANQQVTGVALGLAAGAALSGTVTAQGSAAPIAGASIDVSDAVGDSYRVFTDTAGHYSLTGLPTGTFSAIVNADGEARAVLDNIAVTGAGATADFSLAAGGAVAGAAVDGDGNALGSPLVITAVQHGGDARFQFALTTDDSGFSLGGLPAGIYDVQVAADGFVSQEIANVNVATGATFNLGTLMFNAAASISGTVTASAGLSIAGLSITATTAGQIVGTATTDANGDYSITGLPAGSYVVDVAGAATFHTPANVTVAEGAAQSGINFALQAGGSIEGQVTSTMPGVPVAGITVGAVDATGRAFTTQTDASGNYTFTGLATGAYRVSLHATDAGANVLVNVTQLDGTPVSADLQFSVATQISGQLLLAGNTPPADGRVLLLQGGDIVASTAIDAQGNYRFLFNAPGTYDMQAVSNGASYAPVSGVVAGAGANVTQNFVAGTGALQVAVSDPGNSTAGDVLVVQQVATGEIVAQITLDASGAAVVSNLAAGSYAVSVTGDGSRGASTTVPVVADATANASLSESAASTVSGTIATTGGPGTAAGGFVAIYPAGVDSAQVAPIAADGTYAIPNVPAGTYTAVIFAPGYVATVLPSVTVNGATNLSTTLSASTSAVTGRVLDPNGNPLGNVDLEICDQSGRVLGIAVTDQNGRFTIDSAKGSNLVLKVVPVDGPTLNFLTALQVNAGQMQDVGDITYNYVALNLLTPGTSTGQLQGGSSLQPLDVLPGVPQPQPGPPTAAITILAQTVQKSALHVDSIAPPSNVCDMTCKTEYDTAVAKKNVQDLAFENLKQADADLKEEARNVLLTAASEVLPLINLALSAVVLLPVIAPAAETVGGGYLVALGLATLADMVNSYQSFLFASKPMDALGQVLQVSSVSQKGLDAFGKLSASLGADLAAAGKPFFGKLGPIGLALDAALTLKQAFSGQLFQKTEQRLQLLAEKQRSYDDAKELYEKAASDAYGANETYERCKNNAGVGSNPNCKPPPPPPPKPPGIVISIPALPPLTGGGSIAISFDPNDISGPGGAGDAHFIPAGQILPYTIEFENQASATASAAVVTITQQLDSDLDLSTFQLTGFGFGGQTFSIDGDHSSYATRLDLRATQGIFLDVTANLNLATGLLTWSFTSIDPATGDVPADPNLGFLPPDSNGVEGTGFVSYAVQPKATAQTGDVINAQASVVFDANAPILTPAIFNTVDAAAPTAHVTALPAQSGPDFTVQWSGSDDLNGSGIASYDVFVSEDHGAYAPLLLDTTKTAMAFTGEVGHSYQFFATAIDFAGNEQPAPLAMPDASVTIVPATELTVDALHPLSFLDQNGQKVSVKLTGPGSGKVELLFGAASNADLRSLVLTGTTKQSALKISVAPGGSTTIGRIDGTLKSLTLGTGVTLGDGLDDGVADLTLHGALQSLKLANVANFAQIEVGEDLTPVTAAKLHPTFTAGDLGNDVDLSSMGGFGAIAVHSWGTAGGLDANQSVASINIATGSWFVATVDLDSAHLAPGTASLGPVLLSGPLQASSLAIEGSIKKITAGGLLGSVITAGGALGNVAVNLKKQPSDISAVDGSSLTAARIGNITANVSALAGLHFARGIDNSFFDATAGNIGNISASVTGPDVDDGAAIDFTVFTAPQGSIGNISASAKSAAATTALEAIRETDFFAGINVGNVSALAIASNAAPAAGQSAAFASGDNRDVTFTASAGHVGTITATAQGAADSNEVFATDPGTRIRVTAGTSIGAITLTANKGAATNSETLVGDAASIFAGTSIGAVKLTGNATANQGSDLVFYAGGKIASVTVSAIDPTLGTLTDSLIATGQSTAIAKNSDLAKAALGALTVSGSLLDSTVVANGNLGALKVGGDALNTYFVAGVDVGDDTSFLTGDDTYNRNASIASLTVGGQFSQDTVAAGVDPGSLFLFGDADDTLAPAIVGVTATAKIGAIKLGAATVPANATTVFAGPVTVDHTDAIEAPLLTSIRIGSRPLFHDFTSPVWIDGNGDGVEDASEVVVRTLP